MRGICWAFDSTVGCAKKVRSLKIPFVVGQKIELEASGTGAKDYLASDQQKTYSHRTPYII